MPLKFILLYLIYVLITLFLIFVIFKLAEYKKREKVLTKSKRYFITQGLLIQVIILLILYILSISILKEALTSQIIRYFAVFIYFVILDSTMDYLLAKAKEEEFYDYLELSFFVVYGILTALTMVIFLVKML